MKLFGYKRGVEQFNGCQLRDVNYTTMVERTITEPDEHDIPHQEIVPADDINPDLKNVRPYGYEAELQCPVTKGSLSKTGMVLKVVTSGSMERARAALAKHAGGAACADCTLATMSEGEYRQSQVEAATEVTAHELAIEELNAQRPIIDPPYA